MNTKAVVLMLGVLGAALAIPQDNSYGKNGNGNQDPPAAPAKYEYTYVVKDDQGNDYGQQENRDGDQIQGSYHVELPDGRRQQVTYSVDSSSGYQATVEYEGEATFPPSTNGGNNGYGNNGNNGNGGNNGGGYGNNGGSGNGGPKKSYGSGRR